MNPFFLLFIGKMLSNSGLLLNNRLKCKQSLTHYSFILKFVWSQMMSQILVASYGLELGHMCYYGELKITN